MKKNPDPKSDVEHGSSKARTKAKPITQSTRFAPQQMREIEQACTRKGWSISQMMLIATLEKAVGVNQAAERPQQVVDSVKMLAAALYGIMPRIKCADVDILDPEVPCSGWDEDFGYDLDRNRYEVSYDKKERTVTIRDRLIYEIAENYGLEEKELEDMYQYWEIDMAITPVSISTESVQGILNCLSALGSEIAPLVKEAYQSLIFERGRVGAEARPKKLKTALDLLQPEGDE